MQIGGCNDVSDRMSRRIVLMKIVSRLTMVQGRRKSFSRKDRSGFIGKS